MTPPTLAEIRNRIVADMQDAIPASYPAIVSTIGYVLAAVMSAAVWGVYQFAAWVYSQIFADTATGDNVERIANFYGLQRVLPVAATGTIEITGTPSTVIASGSTFARLDGAEYTTDAEYTIGGGGTVSADVTAVVAGAAGNLASGSLTLVDVISGVDAEATITTALAGGADAETDEALRLRLLDRLRNPPHGGSEADYIGWVRAATPGVSGVWVYPQGYGPGTVGIYFTVIGADPIPSSGTVATVQAYIDPLVQVTATATVAAPTAQTIAVSASIGTATGFVEATLQGLIETEWEGALRTVGPGETLYLSTLVSAAMGVPGVAWVTITSPAGSVAIDADKVPVLGTVTWT